MDDPLDLSAYEDLSEDTDVDDEEKPVDDDFTDLRPEDVYRERRITCGICGRVFFHPGGRGRPPKYCSPECAEQAKRGHAGSRPSRGEAEEDPEWIKPYREIIRSE